MSQNPVIFGRQMGQNRRAGALTVGIGTDKDMIAATLAAGVLAAAPPVLDPLAAAQEAASLYFEVLDQLEREARARNA